MSIGELKKQVNELHFMLNVTSEHDIRQIREVFKSIIDEAKKDFDVAIHRLNTVNDHATMIYLVKKYFGEEEKSEE